MFRITQHLLVRSEALLAFAILAECSVYKGRDKAQ
jgi:hypothetical protein